MIERLQSYQVIETSTKQNIIGSRMPFQQQYFPHMAWQLH